MKTIIKTGVEWVCGLISPTEFILIFKEIFVLFSLSSWPLLKLETVSQ